MKLKDYTQYLKILHDRYGDDIEVKVKTVTILGDYEWKQKCTNAFRPRYNKEHDCIVLHDFVKHLD